MSSYDLTFDVRFTTDLGVGQVVDSDLRLDLFEYGNASVKESRTLGADPSTSVVQYTDALGIYYSTTVNVNGFAPGDVTAKWYANSAGGPVVPYPFVESLGYPSFGGLEISEAKDWIKRQLGYPLVQVELSDEQLTDACSNALEDFDKFNPILYYKALDILPGVTRYGPFSDADVGDGVIHVQFTDRFRNPHVHDPFFGISYLNELRGDFKTFVIADQFRETLERVDSEEPEFRWDPVTRYLMVHSPNTQYRATLIFTKRHTVNAVPRQWHQDFRRLSLSYAREILAEVRGKYELVPTPKGGGRLDADKQLDRSEKERTAIHERLRAAGFASIPMLWDRS